MSTLVSITYEGIRYQHALLTPDGGVSIDRHETKVGANVAPTPTQFRTAARKAREQQAREMQVARGWQRQIRLGVDCSKQIRRHVSYARWWARQARWLDTMALAHAGKLAPSLPSEFYAA